MTDQHYIVMTVECPRCKIEQKVRVTTRPVHELTGNETIRCINCDHNFKITIPDKIIRGPFRA